MTTDTVAGADTGVVRSVFAAFGGTLRPVPWSFLADGEGRVAVLVQVSGSRPDGRSFDNPQIVLFTPGSGRVRTAGQFVGDPAAVTAFWA